LTRIESNAFSSCCSLTSITIPRHVQILSRRPALSTQRSPLYWTTTITFSTLC
jgi:hypothetical protein